MGCAQGYGLGLYDLGVQFADLDGDGKADYICIEPNTHATGFLNMGSNVFEDLGQVKIALDGLDRANVRYVDVNGDKRADLVWIDKYTGAADVYLNGGKIPTSGSAFKWETQGSLFPARTGRGQTVYFADLNGDGRKDYLVAEPDNDKACAWWNDCSDTSSTGTRGTAPTLPVDPY